MNVQEEPSDVCIFKFEPMKTPNEICNMNNFETDRQVTINKFYDSNLMGDFEESSQVAGEKQYELHYQKTETDCFKMDNSSCPNAGRTFSFSHFPCSDDIFGVPRLSKSENY